MLVGCLLNPSALPIDSKYRSFSFRHSVAVQVSESSANARVVTCMIRSHKPGSVKYGVQVAVLVLLFNFPKNAQK